MLFEKYPPREGKMVHVLDHDGKFVLKDYKPPLNIDQATDAMKRMLFARTADLMAVSYQRQGRMYTYPPNQGQEAIATAVGIVMKKDDWLVPAFRELAAWLAKGVKLEDVYLYFRGHEDASRFKGVNHMLPVSVPIASQLLHAAGIGYSIRVKKEKDIVWTFVGDGGTSEGDFHESLNFAAVWKAPVVFIIQNNQYAISVPVAKQTVSKNLAIKAEAYGMPGIQVDGNDIFALTDVFREADEHTRSGRGPVLVEAVTYRRGAHTTSDDPTKYRTSEEEEEWDLKDPLLRLRNWLSANGKWDDTEEHKVVKQYKKEIDRAFSVAENYPAYKLEDVFRFMYEEMPDELRRQQTAYEKFQNWKEGRK